MTFNKQGHPRDKDGKFTFKNGGNSSASTLKHAAKVLYGKKSKKRQQKELY